MTRSPKPLAASPAEKNLRDLAYLRLLPQVERSFTDQTRAAFEAALDKLVARAPELDRAGARTFGDAQDLCAHSADRIRSLGPYD